MYSDTWFCPKLKSSQYLIRTSPTLKSMSTYPESTLLFENPEFTVRALSVSEMDNSVYLLTMRHSGEQLLIDPADDAEALYAFTLDALLHDCPHLELTDAQDHRVRVIESEADFEAVRQRAIGVTSIVVTHGHWDHIRAINGLEKFTGAITSAGAEDIEAIHELEGFKVEESLMGGETFDFMAVILWFGLSQFLGTPLGRSCMFLKACGRMVRPPRSYLPGTHFFQVVLARRILGSSLASFSQTSWRNFLALLMTTRLCFLVMDVPRLLGRNAPIWRNGANGAGRKSADNLLRSARLESNA